MMLSHCQLEDQDESRGSAAIHLTMARSIAPPNKIMRDPASRGAAHATTRAIDTPACFTKPRSRGTRYAAWNPSTRLLITPDAAHIETTAAMIRTLQGCSPATLNCC